MIIELKNVQKTYAHQAVPSLQIDYLKIEPGHLYDIIGPNGAGKSTLFKEWTGRQNIDYFATLKGYTENDNLDIMAEKLALTDVLDTKVRDYSLGMNKKLILLIALMVILDEPFRGIDRQSVDQLTSFIKTDFMRPNKTVLISSHVANDIESVADSYIYLSDGKLMDQGEISANIMVITTKQAAIFVKVLTDAGMDYSLEHESFVLTDISDEQWSSLFRQAVQEGVTFDTVNRQTDIRKRLN